MANGTGLFTQLGFDPRSQEQILAERQLQRRQQIVAAAQASAPGITPAGRTASSLGANIAAALSQRISPQLTPEEQRQEAIKTRGQELFIQRVRAAEGTQGQLTQEEKAIEYMRALSMAAQELGDYQTMHTLAISAAQQARAMRESQLQLSRLEEGNAQQRLQGDIVAAEAERARSGTPVQILLPDNEGRYNPLGAPVVGLQQPDGSMKILHPQTGQELFRTYQYIPYESARLMNTMASNNDRGNLIKTLRDLWSTGEIQEARDTALAMNGQMDVIQAVGQLVKRVSDQGVDPNMIMGRQGGLLSIVDDARSAINSIGQYASFWIDPSTEQTYLTGDLSSPEQINIVRQKDAEFDRAYNRINVPNSIVGSAERQQYKSLVVQLAYAQWRLQEGSGARQASNQDIIMAMDAIGARSGNINNMLRVIMTNLSQGIRGLQHRVDQSYQIGTWNNTFTRQDIDSLLFGQSMQDVLSRYDETVEFINDILNPTATSEEIDELLNR